MESSLCEKPERHAPRRLSDHLGLEGLKQKVHSLVDKVYSRTNLMLAWERVRANRGSGGTDGISIEDFETHLEINLDRLHRELRDGTYQPQPVRRIEIPKRGASGKTRPLESVREHHAGLHSFRSMRRMEARRRKASALWLRHSQSLAVVGSGRAKRMCVRRSSVWAARRSLWLDPIA